MNKNNLTNKVIVVTGAANGIGACIAQTFVERGATVAFSDINEEAGKVREQALNELVGAPRAKFIKTDASDALQIEQFVNTVLADFSKVDLLINNAGIGARTPLLMRPLSEWDDVLATNLRSAYLCAQLLVESLASTKGNIINIASTRAMMSEADTEPYSASKGGIVALTHALAISLGKYGIRVNCISPGWIDVSPWYIPAPVSPLRDIDHKQHPVGRVGKPEDIAEACLFLASNTAAGFITGHNLVVDGGMTRKMIYV
jgi:NAD(P)-dependent dehydrogenase (short-subunit alcohol dehydrogenase family)